MTLPQPLVKKIVTLPQPLVKKIVTLPTSIQSYFLKHYCPELNCPVRLLSDTDAQSVSYFFQNSRNTLLLTSVKVER